MDKSMHIFSDHEVFTREFIASYKQHPVLWQQKHPQYRNRIERTEAYKVLAKKCQKYYPEADEDFVKMKIDSMRSTFRRERRKVLTSKENSEEEVYKPSLWYYGLLLFTVGEETENETTISENKPEDGNLVKIPFWNREHTALLINFYKSYPCLYNTSHPHYKNKRRRNDAVKSITEKLMAMTGKRFNAEDVRRKISLIRGQFLHEYKKIKKSEHSGNIYQPSLWCFEILNFLTDEYKKGKSNKIKELHMNLRQKNRNQHIIINSDSDDNLDIKRESDSSISSGSVKESVRECVLEDDIFDTIAKNVAHKLREMTEEQRNIAKRIVKDVMYYGQMENLTAQSRLSLDGN